MSHDGHHAQISDENNMPRLQSAPLKSMHENKVSHHIRQAKSGVKLVNELWDFFLNTLIQILICVWDTDLTE